MNYEYSQIELDDFTKEILLSIAQAYSLKIPSYYTKRGIVEEILKHQKSIEQPEISKVKPTKSISKTSAQKRSTGFNFLPAELYLLLAQYLKPEDILQFSYLNKRIRNLICRNNNFLKYLGHKYLTANDNKLPANKNILKELNALIEEIRPNIWYFFNGNTRNKGKYAFAYMRNLIGFIRRGYDSLFKYYYTDESTRVINDYKTSYGNKKCKVKDFILNHGLYEAVEQNNFDLVKYLVANENKAIYLNPCMQSSIGRTYLGDAIGLASFRGYTDIYKYLSEYFNRYGP